MKVQFDTIAVLYSEKKLTTRGGVKHYDSIIQYETIIHIWNCCIQNQLSRLLNLYGQKTQRLELILFDTKSLIPSLDPSSTSHNKCNYSGFNGAKHKDFSTTTTKATKMPNRPKHEQKNNQTLPSYPQNYTFTPMITTSVEIWNIIETVRPDVHQLISLIHEKILSVISTWNSACE